MRSSGFYLVLLAAVAVFANDLPEESSVIQRIVRVQNEISSSKKIPTAEEILPLLPSDLSVFLPVIQQIKNENCKRQAEMFLYGLHNLTSWAVQMFDASAKVPAGVLSGSTYNFGNFDECVDTSVSLDSEHIEGKYCLARVLLAGLYSQDSQPRQPFTAWDHLKKSEDRKRIPKDVFHLAFCIPSVCSEKDLQDFLTDTITKRLSEFNVEIEVKDYMCQVKRDFGFDYKDIIFIFVMAFFLLFLTVASMYDVYTMEDTKENENPSILREVVIAFSVPNNLKKLVKYNSSDSGLDCLFGIKLFSMMFILLGHCTLFRSGGPVLNTQFLEEAMMKFENGMLFNNQLFVDTFFLVSGFLLSYYLLKELDKRKSVNVLYLYIFRFLRLTPAYVAVIAFYTTVFYKLDSGPLWEVKVGLERERCLNSWWTNALYINNYVQTENLCMFQSWFISVDTHMFLLAVLLVIPLHRSPMLGQVLLLLATAASIAVPFAVTYLDSLDPLLMLYPREMEDISQNYSFLSSYIKTHMRATPYLCGVVLGYLLYNFQQSGQKISKTAVYCGWVLGPLCAISSMFSVAAFYAPGYQYRPLEAAIYAGLDKVGWCLGTGWLIFACCTNNGGPLQRLLTWRPLVPLSRLTYCAYLVNGMVELHGAGTLREPAYLSIMSYAKASLSNTVLTFVCALVLCLALDSPIHALQTCLLRREKRPRDTTKETAS